MTPGAERIGQPINTPDIYRGCFYAPYGNEKIRGGYGG